MRWMDDLDPIVRDEQGLLADVRERLGRTEPEEGASEEEIIGDLRRIQDEIRTAKTEDKPALEQQYEQLCRLLDQLRRGKQTEGVDPESPYFAHLRSEQEGRVSDLFIGRATCLEAGLRIVDWRHAPVAKLYYRYQEAEEFEEDIGPRIIHGRILARRTVSIRRGVLDRVAAPQGVFERHGDTWEKRMASVPRLATGAVAARVETASGQRLGSGLANREIGRAHV